LFYLLAALLAFSPGLVSQEVLKQVDLDDGQGAPDYAFGMELSPDGTSLHVAICGHWGDNNNRVVEIDTALDQVVDEGVTELYPEEVAFKKDWGSAIELIFVSNNTSSSITVLKPDLSHEHTIVLGDPMKVWPFGLLMGPSGRYLYATTVNEGEIFVIDTDPGPDYLEVVDTHHVAAWNGRLQAYGNKLVIPGSDGTQGAVLSVMDLDHPDKVETVVLDPDTSGYPMANDLAITADGFAYVPVYDFSGHSDLFEVDLNLTPPAIARTIDMSSLGPGYSWEHGICASADGNTLIVTYAEDTWIKIVGRKVGRVLKAMDVNPDDLGMINEALFSHDGDKLYLTDQALPMVYVLIGVPEHGLLLDGTNEVLPAGPVQLEMKGGETGQPGILLMSLTLGPITAPTFTLDIGFPHWILISGLFDGSNGLYIPGFNCPDDPGLSGLDVYFQGLTRDKDQEFRPTNLHTVTIK
jgi:DNA-binding beta-propeller fold protein YncE